VAAIPEKRWMLIVVRHQVSSNIRAEYNLCCIRRYTASSLRIPEQLIVGTSENSVTAKLGEYIFQAVG
jgi:hypothetical protein